MNPILIDIPIRLETDRLFLRVPRPGDGNVVNHAIRDSINELKMWLPFAQKKPTIEETELNLREAYIRFLKRESMRYLIFHKERNEFIGVTSFEGIDWDVPKAQIGYWIHTKHSGNGFMIEAVNALSNLGLDHLKFNRIEIRCESTNVKSRTIPERLGFELEGTLKNEDLSADGRQLTDTCIYSKIQNNM